LRTGDNIGKTLETGRTKFLEKKNCPNTNIPTLIWLTVNSQNTKSPHPHKPINSWAAINRYRRLDELWQSKTVAAHRRQAWVGIDTVQNSDWDAGELLVFAISRSIVSQSKWCRSSAYDNVQCVTPIN